MSTLPWRELVTPEGVDLRLKVGSAGERFFALMLDLVIIGAVLVALTVGLIALAFRMDWAAGWEALGVVWLLGAFLLRNFYFTAFELRPGAATPGKRAMGLRVIARSGGRLTADMVFVRNAMRELELFLPISLLAGSGPGVNGWMALLGLTWTGVLAFFPLFNRDRLRVGDLVAGTLVVSAPRRKLQRDLAVTRVGEAGLAFTQAQLDAYGEKELHVLEECSGAETRPSWPRWPAASAPRSA